MTKTKYLFDYEAEEDYRFLIPLAKKRIWKANKLLARLLSYRTYNPKEQNVFTRYNDERARAAEKAIKKWTEILEDGINGIDSY